MLERILTFAILAAAGWWFWSTTYQGDKTPDYDARLEVNAEKMKQCLRSAAYKEGATGIVEGNKQELCAKKLNLYLSDGQWHNYADVRPD